MMNNETLLAKSNGCTLVSHLRAVSRLAEHLAHRLGADANLVELCRIAGLVHDIGKAWPGFQQYLTTGGTEEWDDLQQYHNEVGYVVLANVFDDQWCSKFKSNVTCVAEAILWHHSCRQGDAWVSLSASDVAAILEFTSFLLPDARYNSEAAAYCSQGLELKVNAKSMFVPVKPVNHEEQVFVRTCLIAADREISAIDDQNMLNSIIDGSFDLNTLPCVANWFRNICDSTSISAPADNYRAVSQKMCSDNIESKPIIQVNAPTGFGKTRIGVIRTLFRGRRTIWVCPRNTVADAVFDNVREEIDALGFTGKLSAELYYTSKRQGATENCPDGEFNADIVVTNIDMLLKPMVNNKCAEQAFFGLCADIVFDEFHEFANPDSAMFAAFVSLLRARTAGSHASTMCLSATPAGILEFIFNGSYEEKCVCLPERGKHFEAVHKKPYSLHLHDKVDIKSIPDGIPGSLVLLNSVRNAQAHYLRNKIGGTLIHSKYTKEDRATRMETVLSLFGPTGNGRDASSENFVVSGPILQAALNISFKSVHLSSGGAEQDLQAARTNRFGEMASGEIHWYNVKNSGEASAIKCRWDRDLQQAWFAYALSHFGSDSTCTLDDIYKVYNSFYADAGNKANVKKTFNAWFQSGYAKINNLAPHRWSNGTRTALSGTARYGTLRNPDGSYNILVRASETRMWLPLEDVFSVSADDLVRLHKKDNSAGYTSNIRDLLRSSDFKQLPQDMKTKWGDVFSENDKDRIKWTAANKDTPMPVFTKVYDSDLGLISSEGNADDGSEDFVA